MSVILALGRLKPEYCKFKVNQGYIENCRWFYLFETLSPKGRKEGRKKGGRKEREEGKEEEKWRKKRGSEGREKGRDGGK
jgi:hypothetical protein